MLFSKIFSVAATVFTAVALAQAQITPGRYRIHSGTQTARSYPGGHQGPFRSEITMAGDHVGIWELWDITSDGGEGYIIRNAGTGAKAYTPSLSLNQQVFAASNQQTSWFIEHKGVEDSQGNPLYAIKIPYQDLLWTNTARPPIANMISLKGSDGSRSQRFVFQRV